MFSTLFSIFKILKFYEAKCNGLFQNKIYYSNVIYKKKSNILKNNMRISDYIYDSKLS